MKLVKLILSVAAVTVLGAGLAYADGGLMGRLWNSDEKSDAIQEKEQGEHADPAPARSETEQAVNEQKTDEDMSKKSDVEKEVKQVKETTKTVKKECPSEAKKECDEENANGSDDEKKECDNDAKKECDEESSKKECENEK